MIDLKFTTGKITQQFTGDFEENNIKKDCIIKSKICIKCNQEFPANTEYFYKHKTSKDGLTGACKKCRNEQAKNNINYKKNKKNNYEKNKEKILKQIKEYRDRNKEKIAQRHHEYYLKNKDKLNKMTSENRKKNKERHNEYSKKWAKNNLEKVRMSNQKRKAKIKTLSKTLTLTEWNEIKKIFNNKCAYCGREVLLEQEHFIPLSKGGEYTHNNIIPACKSCNSSKCNKNFFVWYPQQDFYDKNKENKILKFLNYTKDGKQQLSFIMEV